MRTRQNNIAAGVLFLLAAAGGWSVWQGARDLSTQSGSGVLFDAKGGEKISMVDASDPAWGAAVGRVRARVGIFIAALKAPKAGQRRFAIKKLFRGSFGSEQMWISRLSFDGRLFHGVLDNTPSEMRSVKAGDRVTCAIPELSDWMFVDRGKLVGGETIRLVYSRQSPQKKEFLAADSFRF